MSISQRAYSYRLHAYILLQGLFVSGKLLQERATVSGKGQTEHRVHNYDHYHDPTLCRQPYVTHVTVFRDVFLVAQSNELQYLLNRGSTTEDEALVRPRLWLESSLAEAQHVPVPTRQGQYVIPLYS
jgi:hypothetical protein